jgi:cell division inhibitor SepF
MGLFDAILRFFGLAEPANDEIIEYPEPASKAEKPPENKLVDYRRDVAPKPPEYRISVVRPELNKYGRVTFSLSVYTENLREGCVLLVDLSRIVNQNREEARRIVSFLSGVAEAIKGKRREIAPNLYLFAPPHVQVKGDVARDGEP